MPRDPLSPLVSDLEIREESNMLGNIGPSPKNERRIVLFTSNCFVYIELFFVYIELFFVYIKLFCLHQIVYDYIKLLMLAIDVYELSHTHL